MLSRRSEETWSQRSLFISDEEQHCGTRSGTVIETKRCMAFRNGGARVGLVCSSCILQLLVGRWSPSDVGSSDHGVDDGSSNEGRCLLSRIKRPTRLRVGQEGNGVMDTFGLSRLLACQAKQASRWLCPHHRTCITSNEASALDRQVESTYNRCLSIEEETLCISINSL